MDKTKSGIILAEKEHLDEAKVVEVSKDVELVKKGDLILLKNYSTDEIEVEGEKYSFIKEENVLAIKK